MFSAPPLCSLCCLLYATMSMAHSIHFTRRANCGATHLAGASPTQDKLIVAVGVADKDTTIARRCLRHGPAQGLQGGTGHGRLYSSNRGKCNTITPWVALSRRRRSYEHIRPMVSTGSRSLPYLQTYREAKRGSSRLSVRCVARLRAMHLARRIMLRCNAPCRCIAPSKPLTGPGNAAPDRARRSPVHRSGDRRR